jgi:hypothetical protein
MHSVHHQHHPEAKYAICFDFPEIQEPLFASWHQGELGFARNVGSSARFSTEESAASWLVKFGPNVSKFGTVVEVGS